MVIRRWTWTISELRLASSCVFLGHYNGSMTLILISKLYPELRPATKMEEMTYVAAGPQYRDKKVMGYTYGRKRTPQRMSVAHIQQLNARRQSKEVGDVVKRMPVPSMPKVMGIKNGKFLKPAQVPNASSAQGRYNNAAKAASGKSRMATRGVTPSSGPTV